MGKLRTRFQHGVVSHSLTESLRQIGLGKIAEVVTKRQYLKKYFSVDDMLVGV